MWQLSLNNVLCVAVYSGTAGFCWTIGSGIASWFIARANRRP